MSNPDYRTGRPAGTAGRFCAWAIVAALCGCTSAQSLNRAASLKELRETRSQGFLLVNALHEYRDRHGHLPFHSEDGSSALRQLAPHINGDHPAPGGDHSSAGWVYINISVEDVDTDRIVLSTADGLSQHGKRYVFGMNFDFLATVSQYRDFAAGDWIDWRQGVAFARKDVYLKWRRTHREDLNPIAATHFKGDSGRSAIVETFPGGVTATYDLDPHARLQSCRWRLNGRTAILIETMRLDARGRISSIERTPDNWEEAWSLFTGKAATL